MMDLLLLRLDAPLVSFGAPIVDNYGFVQPWPACSMLTGLLANALGWEHGDFDKLNRLQARLYYAVRCDRPGQEIIDYQTVDLGLPHMLDTGWTTRGIPEKRVGGKAIKGTHIRYRHYFADSIHTVALTLQPDSEEPTLDDLEQYLHNPVRPLFIGRKCCLPSQNILLGRIHADSLLDALRKTQPVEKNRQPEEWNGKCFAWWPDDANEESGSRSQKTPVTDCRDWLNQIHCGQRFIRQGLIELELES